MKSAFDLDDLLDGIEIGPKGGPKTQTFFRVLFGALGTFLAAAGRSKFLLRPEGKGGVFEELAGMEAQMFLDGARDAVRAFF